MEIIKEGVIGGTETIRDFVKMQTGIQSFQGGGLEGNEAQGFNAAGPWTTL